MQVFYSRNKLKPEAESPECSAGKVSFKWDAGSCSGASSVCSPLSLPSASTSRNDHSHIHTINSASRLSFTCEKPRHGPTISSTSMAAAAGDEPVRNGQWITTDSECESKSFVNVRFKSLANSDIDFGSVKINCSCGAGALIERS